MRTTLHLDDHLLEDAKQLAADQGTTLTDLFTQALREKIARCKAAARAKPVAVKKLPTFSGNGPRPGVDLHDTASLYDVMSDADS